MGTNYSPANNLPRVTDTLALVVAEWKLGVNEKIPHELYYHYIWNTHHLRGSKYEKKKKTWSWLNIFIHRCWTYLPPHNLYDVILCILLDVYCKISLLRYLTSSWCGKHWCQKVPVKIRNVHRTIMDMAVSLMDAYGYGWAIAIP